MRLSASSRVIPSRAIILFIRTSTGAHTATVSSHKSTSCLTAKSSGASITTIFLSVFSTIPFILSAITGCRILFSFSRADLSPNTTFASAFLKSLPFSKTSSENSSFIFARTFWSESVISWEILSASTISAPYSSKIFAAAVFPLPLPPVRPIILFCIIPTCPFSYINRNGNTKCCRIFHTAL